MDIPGIIFEISLSLTITQKVINNVLISRRLIRIEQLQAAECFRETQQMVWSCWIWVSLIKITIVSAGQTAVRVSLISITVCNLVKLTWDTTQL